jgi:hypothetical protein
MDFLMQSGEGQKPTPVVAFVGASETGHEQRSQPKLTSHQRREAIARREAGEVLTDIARFDNVGHSTISRLS